MNTEYLIAKAKMTNRCNMDCKNCLLGYNNNAMGVDCRELENEYPEKAVEIVEQWAAEHPPKTRQSEFLRVYPDALIKDDAIAVCPGNINPEAFTHDGRCKMHGKACDVCRREYWLAEVE